MNCKTTEGTKNVLKKSYVEHTAKIGDSENRMWMTKNFSIIRNNDFGVLVH